MVKKINIVTLGCSKNVYDSELLLGGFKRNNFEITSDPVDADYVIVNTCGFLDQAREESIDVILDLERLRKTNKISQLVVAGCMSERFEDEMRDELDHVDHFFGTNDTNKIIDFICSKAHQKFDPDFNRINLTPKHYGYLKISEGCDNGCSFCSIPLMRGLQKSQPIEWNVQEARRMSLNGTKEILVIAQDSTSYGWDLRPRASLDKLLYSLNNIENVDWIRLHYAHPAHLKQKIINCFRDLEKMLPYIDMPIQHASNNILSSMRRGLNIDGIKRKIDQLKNVRSDIAIRTSLIVGFPNETDRDFDELYSFVRETEFDRLGVFMYSEEDGTVGHKNLEDNVPKEVKKSRLDEIMKLQYNISIKNNSTLIGSTQKVIIDTITHDGKSIGRTFRDSPEIDNTVTINSKLNVGSFYDVLIKDISAYDIFGEVVN
tara:strand:+ start:1830 stop:3122 length:1293 start_codon:yes stop_codon:yes gene_type:complete